MSVGGALFRPLDLKANMTAGRLANDTGTGVAVSTRAYMSPEEGKRVDQRSDIYSLGVVLNEMLRGQVP